MFNKFKTIFKMKKVLKTLQNTNYELQTEQRQWLWLFLVFQSAGIFFPFACKFPASLRAKTYRVLPLQKISRQGNTKPFRQVDLWRYLNRSPYHIQVTETRNLDLGTKVILFSNLQMTNTRFSGSDNANS